VTEGVLDIRNRLFGPPRRPLKLVVPETAEVVPAFALEDKASGRVTISTPLTEVASAESGRWIRRLQGRLVEAGRANRNGAFWTQEDLEFGLPTIAHGPVNCGHDDATVIGVLTDAELAEASGGIGPHVQVTADMWRWINPGVTARIENAVLGNRAFLSMECVSKQIQCTGPGGCGAIMSYEDAQNRGEGACQHVQERSSLRRFIEPTFLGAGVIIPPDEPAWSQAVLTEAARVAETHVEAASAALGMPEDQAHRLVAAIVAWTRRPV